MSRSQGCPSNVWDAVLAGGSRTCVLRRPDICQPTPDGEYLPQNTLFSYDMSNGDLSRETAVSSPEVPHKRTLDLEEYELETNGRPSYILTWPEVKLLGIAGVCD